MGTWERKTFTGNLGHSFRHKVVTRCKSQLRNHMLKALTRSVKSYTKKIIEETNYKFDCSSPSRAPSPRLLYRNSFLDTWPRRTWGYPKSSHNKWAAQPKQKKCKLLTDSLVFSHPSQTSVQRWQTSQHVPGSRWARGLLRSPLGWYGNDRRQTPEFRKSILFCFHFWCRWTALLWSRQYGLVLSFFSIVSSPSVWENANACMPYLSLSKAYCRPKDACKKLCGMQQVHCKDSSNSLEVQKFLSSWPSDHAVDGLSKLQFGRKGTSPSAADNHSPSACTFYPHSCDVHTRTTCLL